MGVNGIKPFTNYLPFEVKTVDIGTGAFTVGRPAGSAAIVEL
jgi:hypothetical protein